MRCSIEIQETLKDVDELNIRIGIHQGDIILKDGDVLYAAKKFNESELLYPQSSWAPSSSLMASFAYYSYGY